MDFNEYQKKNAKEIEAAITSLFTSQKNTVFTTHPLLKELYAVLANSTKGGKYLRGMLVRLGFEMTGHKHTNSILPIAAAYEILHTSLLTLDDVIDKSPLRRGRPSVWQKVGTNQALCLTEIGFFLANKTIAESKFGAKIKTQATSLFSRLIMDTIAGEMLDVALSRNHTASGSAKNIQKDEIDVLQIHTLKTAQYSISGPLMLGALFGGADEKTLKKLTHFGEYVGIAFQIQDDILGVFGDEKQVGKSVTSDSEENKNTLLITYALDHASLQQKKILEEYYGKKDMTAKEFEIIKNLFTKIGSLSYSQKKAQEYIEKAKQSIPTITKNKTLQKLLTEFADFVVQRAK